MTLSLRTSLKTILLCAGLVLLPASQLTAGVPTPGLVAELSAEAARQLGYAEPAPPPEIRVVSAATLEATAEALSGHSAQGRGLVALYLPDRRLILLTQGWDAATLRDRSVLLHELVHHADHHAERVAACPGEVEKRAYDVQQGWLTAQGSSLQRAFGLDAFTLLVLTSCGY